MLLRTYPILDTCPSILKLCVTLSLILPMALFAARPDMQAQPLPNCSVQRLYHLPIENPTCQMDVVLVLCVPLFQHLDISWFPRKE